MTHPRFFVPLHHVCTKENQSFRHNKRCSCEQITWEIHRSEEVWSGKVAEEADELFQKAQLWLRTHDGQQELDFDDRKGKEVEETERFLSNIDNVLINGTQLLLDQIYDSVGFNQIPDEILRHLVIARVSHPKSKLATVDYLKSYYDEDVDLNHIYRYMDKLYNTQMELAQQISVEHTTKSD